MPSGPSHFYYSFQPPNMKYIVTYFYSIHVFRLIFSIYRLQSSLSNLFRDSMMSWEFALVQSGRSRYAFTSNFDASPPLHLLNMINLVKVDWGQWTPTFSIGMVLEGFHTLVDGELDVFMQFFKVFSNTSTLLYFVTPRVFSEWCDMQ